MLIRFRVGPKLKELAEREVNMFNRMPSAGTEHIWPATRVYTFRVIRFRN